MTSDIPKISGDGTRNKSFSDTPAAELAALFANLEKLNHRLERLERQVCSASPAESHPSLDRLNIGEAITDDHLHGLYAEKACQFEPDKPCDHCSMCNSRGF